VSRSDDAASANVDQSSRFGVQLFACWSAGRPEVDGRTSSD